MLRWNKTAWVRFALPTLLLLVMNVMLVLVTQRTGEIGLLKALSATARTIRTAFLTEATMLSLVGVFTALATGLVFGVMSAKQAAQLDPVLALSKR